MTDDIRLIEFEDPESLSRRLASLIEERAAEAVAERGMFTLCLAGGSSPVRTYEVLAGRNIPWTATHVFFGDDRLVPPSHAWSNYRMARTSLLDRIDIPPANVHRMRGEMSSPAAAARDYEKEMRKVFGEYAAAPSMDVCLLGLGPDGHTASLFPGHETLLEDRAWAAGVTGPTLPPKVRRITLTPPALDASRLVVFVAPGASKRPIIDEIVGDREAAAKKYPAAMVRAREVVWMATQGKAQPKAT